MKLLIYIILTMTVILFLYNLIYPAVEAANVEKSVTQVLIDIEDCKLYIIKDGVCTNTYPVAVGTYKTPSPLGYFYVTDKGLWGEGFGGYWIGLNVKWGKYGIHGTTSPDSVGWYASHGCFRMYSKDIAEIYTKIPFGTKVLVVNGINNWFNSGLRILKPSDTGGDVLYVQYQLEKLGYYTGNKNGIFNSELTFALNKFQKDNNLKIRNVIAESEFNALGITLDD